MDDEARSEHGATSRARRMIEDGFSCPQSRMVTDPWPAEWRQSGTLEQRLDRVSQYFR